MEDSPPVGYCFPIETQSHPVALTIAGSDSSSGAGIQADLKTFSALGVHGVTAVTAIVSEIPGSVSGYRATDPELLQSQIEGIRKAFPVAAIKTGMLASSTNVETVCRILANHPSLSEVVVDPVFRASAGTALLDQRGVALLRSDLLPRVKLATPNWIEACFLLERDVNPGDASKLPRWLFEKFGCEFLVKGGHHPDRTDEIVDHAYLGGDSFAFRHPRLAVGDIHGTGCTLSAAITAHLAHGAETETAVRRGIDYLTATLRSPIRWSHPRATEALNHFPDDVKSLRP